MSTEHEHGSVHRRDAICGGGGTILGLMVATLLGETRPVRADAIVAVEAEVKLHRERTLDITADVQTEQQSVARAELDAKRLVGALNRLKSHHNALLQAEISARWVPWFEAVEKKRNAVAEKIKRVGVYFSEIAGTFAEAAAVDQEVRAVNAAKPDSETRYLYGCELHSRGLKSFSRNEPSVAEAMVLPGLWPPKRNPSAAIEALMASPVHYQGEDWADRGARVERERAQERKRMADYYQEMGRAQEDRQNREEQRRIAEDQAQRMQQR